MAFIPKKNSNLFQSIVLAGGANGALTLTAEQLAQNNVNFRIVVEGDTVAMVPDVVGGSAVADAQQWRLFAGETFEWTLRDGEGRLALYNVGTASATISLYAISQTSI